MIDLKEEQGLFVSHFDRFERGAGATSSLLPTRKAAFARFAELGFPTIRHEEWRYTNVSRIADTAFEAACDPVTPVSAEDIAALTFSGTAQLLVFVNGRFSPHLSDVGQSGEGVIVGSLAVAIEERAGVVETHLARHAKYDDHAFVALNTALMEDGALIFVPKRGVIEEPIHLLFVSVPSTEPAVCHPRNLIVLEESSRATVVESYVGLGRGPYFTNTVTEIVVGENAIVDHVKVVREGDDAYHIATLHVHQYRDSQVTSHTVSLSGGLARNDINAQMDGEGCQCTLNGLYHVDGTRHVDNHLIVEHAKPHGDSREFFKGVLDGKGKGIFSGRIIVRKGAQKTDAKQTNQSLLLSPDAQVESRPQLEILADDVKCTHGATIGQVDDEAVFYLCSRGLTEAAARSLLVYAFAKESLDRINVPSLRDQLDQVLLERMPHGGTVQNSV